MVDTQYEEVSDKIVAEIRKLTSKPIRYVINTSADTDHTGGNAKISRAGGAGDRREPGRGGVRQRSHHRGARERAARDERSGEGKADANADMLPTTTFFQGQKEIFFNEEPVIVMFEPAAHTNGDSMVFSAAPT